MLEWVSFFVDFLFDAMYTWQVPGLNISFLFLFIVLAFLAVLLRIVVRLLGTPSTFRFNAKKSKGGDDG